MNATPFYGPAIVLAAVGALALLAIFGMRLLPRMARARAEAARARALAEPAARFGLIAVPDDHLTDLPPFELLNTGTDRRPSNVLRGSMSGASVVVFDYAFTDATKTDQRFRRLHYSPYFAGATVCCVKGAWLSLPQFVMEPLLKPILKHAEALVDQQFGTGRMASAVHAMMQAAERMVHEAPGFQFTDRPDVAYCIRGKDEAAIRSFFTPPVLDYFRDHPGWIVEACGDSLLLTIALELKGQTVTIQTGAHVRTHGQMPPDQLDTLVTAALGTLEIFRAAVAR